MSELITSLADHARSELVFVVVALLYLALVGGYLWFLNQRARMLLQRVREQGPAGLWERLGAPLTMQDAARDPQRRWLKYVRGRVYRTECGPDLATAIDSFLDLTNRGLFFMLLVGGGIVYYFWPLLRQHLF